MLDPNLKGAESGDPTFMWCLSLVMQRRASLSHKFEGEEGVVWAGWDTRRQRLIYLSAGCGSQLACMQRASPQRGVVEGREGGLPTPCLVGMLSVEGCWCV